MTVRTMLLGLAVIAVASCGTPVTVLGAIPIAGDRERIRGRCLAVSECLNTTFGWRTPSALSVLVVSRLEDHVPGVSIFADGYSDSPSATVIIEQSAWRKRPEVLSHELTHLALPEAFSGVTGPLREALCNFAAMACAQSSAESDRLHVQSLIAVFNATGGIAFDVSWQAPSGESKNAQIVFDPSEGAYLSRTAGEPEPPDPDRQIPRTRNLVATFVLAHLARARGIDAALSELLEVASAAGSGYPEMELARRSGIGSVDDLRRAAAGEVDLRDLVQVIQHEAGWLDSRLEALGLDLNGAAQVESTSGSFRVSLQSSNVVATPADLHQSDARTSPSP